ncbi:TIGR01457 family HAD-type hydrolase [Sediminibacillus massiliensis]|uniref:TIGR01457 family HAD-type hydrolase n=1 Tax=Sediminibacillus massiliensis TaxID=1926277 RepID=UPI0009885EEB|nr:TIGR01457 family HAD-type hydrolase [Sediminibacillus massiliensis]
MKHYKGYLIDLDGTMYRGTDCIEDAPDFINKLIKKKIPHLFLTNNSSMRQEQIAEKLRSMGIPAQPENVFTSSMATATYIKEQKPDASVYAIGEDGLFSALEKIGLKLVEEDSDYVVMGIDRGITYEKLAKACLNIRSGAELISTNGDIAIPTERGLLPGNGSLTSVVTVSTGKQALIAGKPEKIIMDQAMEVLGLSKQEILMVGDNYHTDIMAGINAGVDTLMVFTGLTTKEQLSGFDVQPTYQFPTLKEWMEFI